MSDNESVGLLFSLILKEINSYNYISDTSCFVFYIYTVTYFLFHYTYISCFCLRMFKLATFFITNNFISVFQTFSLLLFGLLYVVSTDVFAAIITQVCSGKIVFKIFTFLYRFLCDELKKTIKTFYHVPFFHKTNFLFQGLLFYIHTYWTINTTLKTSFIHVQSCLLGYTAV
jgi:hypothetical protein